MSGCNLNCWKYVIAPIDFTNLAFYKEQFENLSNVQIPVVAKKEREIPKTLHFIWLGPKEFPRASIPNLLSWIEKHPGWTVKFWTGRKRPLPTNNIEQIIVEHSQSKELEKCYTKTNNYAEKTDLLRYEILFKEVGVYIDHDVRCFKSLSDLTNQFELICGLELPVDTPVSSSIHATNSLIAARPFHPILARCITRLPPIWDTIEMLYPGNDKSSVIHRVANRTFAAFADSVRELSGNQTKDMVAPAYYFNAPSDELAVYARHLYAGTWFQNDNPFEEMARNRLMALSKKANKILLFIGVTTGLNMLAIASMFYFLQKKLKI